VVTVRYFAGARAAAGTTEEKVEAGTLADLVRVLEAAHGDDLARVLSASSFLVDEVVCRDREVRLPEDATIDVLPPFAGG
jgi:molybdopterin synthase sulfur carrier subunit